MLFISIYSGKPSFSKKQADLFFPPDFADDFPVAMQVLSLSFFAFEKGSSIGN